MAIATTDLDSTYQSMREKLAGVVPEIELKYKAELVSAINQLKFERNAVILGHNYMEPALFHTVPDHVGDSLELCRKAMTSDADVIVFCGVRFMAETAKILNPGKTVLVPSLEAGCSLAESISAEDVRRLRVRYPGVPIVTYINTYADVKAECDVCCTSSNASKVIRSLGTDRVIFLPDEYLARNTAADLGWPVVFPDEDDGQDTVAAEGPRMIVWRGRCEVHEKFTVDDVVAVRHQFPDVLVLAHPECSPEVVAASDFSGSTSAMIRRVQEGTAPRYLLLTECAMGDNIAAENPEKEMVRLCSVRCPHMNEITLEQTLASLENVQHVVEVPADVASRARQAVMRMLAV